MKLKRLCKTLLYPNIAVMTVLVPTSAVFLILSMVRLGAESPLAVVSYVISAYTLTVWSVRTPSIIKSVKVFKTENKLLLRWQSDARLRVNVSLSVSLIWNTAYAILQLWLGFYHHTFWFYSLAGYHFSLAVMRFFLVRYTAFNKPGEKIHRELIMYRACGWLFLIMNMALTLIIFFMVYWDRTFLHGEIVTITMAAYTFTSLTVAIVNIIKYRKYNSPIYSASKSISLAAASVSLLTLESTMLTTFGGDSTDAFMRKTMLGISGGVIAAFIVVMAIYMIVQATKKLKILNIKEDKNG